MDEVAVIKCDAQGNEVIRYPGAVLERGSAYVVLEARLGLDNLMILDVPFNHGDRFVETYYTDKWFNIHEVHDKGDDRVKAWYCNVAYPAEIGDALVTFRDLALDLLVYSDGRQRVLDEDEFDALEISPADRKNALEGLASLQAHFRERFGK
ncbi:MAG: DUF402 domain-containing protein [Anaerolineales bacterium]